MKTIESQNKKILAYLLKGHKITALDALKKFGCLRISARIFDIKSLGKYSVKSELITTKSGKRVAQYSIPL